VGAGTGSYEPHDRSVTALEPSIEMIRQRGASAAPVVQAYAENLPFDDKSFDAAMAVLTVHHWTDKARGLAEMRRVARGPVVVLTFDPAHRGVWLADYFPGLVALDEAQMPKMTDYEEWLGPVEIAPVRVPHDCADGFLGAYWRRPAAYLDPRIRAAMSSFWKLEDAAAGLRRLESDLNSGAWTARYPDLRDLETYDFGYRLVTSKG
jgi:SAM-dependent methyltransferase